MPYPRFPNGPRRHWWNGVAGGMARYDLYMRKDGDRWTVEYRNRGESIYIDCDSEEQALDEVRRRMVGEGWKEMSTRRHLGLAA
jgi:hypothetical protein